MTWPFRPVTSNAAQVVNDAPPLKCSHRKTVTEFPPGVYCVYKSATPSHLWRVLLENGSLVIGRNTSRLFQIKDWAAFLKHSLPI